MPLVSHLKELRRVILVCAAGLLVSATVAFLAFGDRLFSLLTAPITELSVPVIATRVSEALFAKMSVALVAGFVLAFPLIVWQAGGFILPALTAPERRLALVLFPASLALFACGVAFAYFVVFPLVVRFLLLVAGRGLLPMITIREYLAFVMAFYAPFGLVFQMPLVVYFLCSLGLVSAKWLITKRKYAVLVIFVVAAVLTPGTDVISQVAMAIPMLLLYEVSTLMARFVEWRRARRAGSRRKPSSVEV